MQADEGEQTRRPTVFDEVEPPGVRSAFEQVSRAVWGPHPCPHLCGSSVHLCGVCSKSGW